jgi:hypothetical protein
MDLSKSILSGQYNNTAVTPRDLGHIRGSGQFFTGNGMSSNWQTGQEPTYTREFPNEPFPNQKYELSNFAPVGNDNTLSRKWKFTNTPSNGDPFQQFALNDLNETPSALNMIFFNKTNIDYLQKRIINDVKRLSGYEIKPQDENSLMVYMTNAYVLGSSGWLPLTSVVHIGAENKAQASGEKSCSLRQRLTRLNQTVLQSAMKDVLSGIGMYMTYYKDASSLPIPLELPELMTMKGSRMNMPNIGLHSSNGDGASSFNMRNNIIN